ERQRPVVIAVAPIDHVHAAHHQLGIRDPHDVDNAENQVQPEREQRQHAAEQQAVEKRFDKIDVHRSARSYSPRYAWRTNGLDLSSAAMPASLMRPTSSR